MGNIQYSIWCYCHLIPNLGLNLNPYELDQSSVTGSATERNWTYSPVQGSSSWDFFVNPFGLV